MDPQKIIKRYILPRGMAIAAAVLILAAAVLGALSFVAMGSADTEALEFYPSDSENGTMAYIDVVGISDWLYQYDDTVYYTALDADGYLYTVRLTDSQFKKLAPQLAYWNDESVDAVMPEAFRLEGLVTALSADARSTLADCWQLTTAEFDLYFGTKFLDATTSSGEAAAAPWLVGTLVCGLFGLAFLIVAATSASTARKFLRRLEELGLTQRAAQQLENTESGTVIGKNRGILTQDFLFGKGTGVVVPYADILWCYQLDRKRSFIPVNSYLMVGTMGSAPVGAVDLNRNDRQGVITEALAVIAQRNPNAMVGYSKEAANAFKETRRNG